MLISSPARYFSGDLKRVLILLSIISMSVISCNFVTAQVHAEEKGKELVFLGKWNEKKLDHIIRESSGIQDLGKRIDFLSEQFLNVNYKESTLIGNINTPEVFVINLEGMDCFTYIDYVEAMRLSSSFSQFKENLRRVRYQSGKVTFENRNHFFT